MLKGIDPIVSPELLTVLAQMGHGDELVIADANFPAVSMGRRVVRADGHTATAMLAGILKLLPLDDFVEAPAGVMRRVDKPNDEAAIWSEFQKHLDEAESRNIVIERIERFAFYERAKQAFAVVATGERALYGNLLLKKGVIR